jgi:predicted GNAT family N-acyltransferase
MTVPAGVPDPGVPDPGVPDAAVARPVAGPSELDTVLALRHAVFVVEQGVPAELERDEHDVAAEHVLAELDGAVVATGRLVVEPPGYGGLPAERGPVAHLGRIAVAPAARGRGLGAAVVRALEARAGVRGLTLAYLAAQVPAVGLYARLGYTAFGPEFDDAGLPHRHMWRAFDPPDEEHR